MSDMITKSDILMYQTEDGKTKVEVKCRCSA